jgi:hypothetical protein
MSSVERRILPDHAGLHHVPGTVVGGADRRRSSTPGCNITTSSNLVRKHLEPHTMIMSFLRSVILDVAACSSIDSPCRRCAARRR